jgi:type VI secretion system protein ImpL
MWRIMRFFRWIGSIRVPKWVFVVLGVLFVALLIWFVGPLISIAKWAPLRGLISRLVVIVLVAAGVGGWYGWKRWRARKKNAEMMEELAEAPPQADLSAEDLKEMEERAKAALELMKTARVGKEREFVYELPWYIIIGPPGAGKTTALQNAGLQFPVAQELGAEPLRGIGGTTTTEWWFTDQAVLIDTAGRYTTQDSHQETDSKAWSGFLDLLKRFRDRQPITGILVAISVTDLLGADESDTAAHGRAVRQRINEISQRFGIRPPVYVLLTKLDLLAGFTEFFDDATAADRDQVWGHTFAIEKSRAGDESVKTMGAAFDALVARLNDRVLARVQAERDMGRRGLIFGFPQQFASLRPALTTLMQIIGRETKFEPTPLVRGFYFTSATQFGRPIDRLLSAISAQFKLPPVATGGQTAGGRSYYLRTLLGDVIFKEGALAGQDPQAEKRRRMIRLGVIAAGAALVALLSTAWIYSYVRNASLTRKLAAESVLLQKEVAQLPAGDVSDSDLMQVLPVLNRARDLPFASTAPKNLASAGFSFGLGRKGALRPQVDGAYQNLLNRQLLPRLILSIEDQLRAEIAGTGTADNRPAIYNLLRMYLMLGRNPGAPLEKGQIATWFAGQWNDQFPGTGDDPTRAALTKHLESLLGAQVKPPPLDRELIAAARSRVTSLSSGERAYARLVSDPAMADLPAFTLAEVPSVGTSGLFARRSGKSLSLGVPGMYRRQAFYTVVMPAVAKLAAQSANENWVTGETAQKVTGNVPIQAAEAGRIKDGILVAYLNDFTQHWDDFINDITISGERPVAQRIQMAVRPPSPVKQLIIALGSETNLTPPSSPTQQGSAGARALRVGSLFSSTIYRGYSQMTRIDQAMGSSPKGPPGPLDEVIEHFRWLREMNPAQGPSPLDEALEALGGVADSAAAAKTAGSMGDPLLQRTKAASAMEATARLDQVASALPPVVGGMFTGFVRASTVQLNKSVNDNIQSQYATQLLPECRAVISQGYPFQPGSNRHVTVDDFSRLFRPGGLIDQFAQANLAGMIDTSKRGWTVTPAGKALGLRAETAREFEKADIIRRAFFQPGDVRPNVRFLIEPTQITGAQTVTLTVDGTPVSFDAATRRALEMRWPGPQPGVALSFQGSGGAPAVRSWTGDFALMKMMQDGRIVSSGPRALSFATNVDAYQATFTLRMQNTSNPFTLRELQTFKCPDPL